MLIILKLTQADWRRISCNTKLIFKDSLILLHLKRSTALRFTQQEGNAVVLG